jgi:hypothetical protein
MRYLFICFLILICFFSCISEESSLNQNNIVSQPETRAPSLELIYVDNKTEGLFIETEPIHANVYINNKLFDTSPCTVKNLEYGIYYVTIQKHGYYPYSVWITYSKQKRYYKFSLKPLLGTLSLQVTPPEALVELGNTYISQGTTKIPAGVYALRVKAFGYKEYETDITIIEEKTTSLSVTLEKSPLKITHLTATRAVFNPYNESGLGTTTISFNVSTFARGELFVSDSAGKMIASYDLKPFDDWTQLFEWDGKDKAGIVLPDDSYMIHVKAYTNAGEQVLSEKLSVKIDSSFDLAYRNVWSGISGLLYTPTPEVLPFGSIQFQSLLSAHCNSSAIDESLEAPSTISGRFGMPFNSEIDGTLKFIFKGIELEPAFGITLAYKIRLFNTAADLSFSAGCITKFSYQHDYNLDTYADFTGASIGIPLLLQFGDFYLAATPEVIFSWQTVSLSSSETGDSGFHVWLYARTGIFYDTEFLLCGLSLSMRSAAFSQDFALDLPLHAGFEINILIPQSPLYISGLLGMEYLDSDIVYILGGVGFGLLW